MIAVMPRSFFPDSFAAQEVMTSGRLVFSTVVSEPLAIARFPRSDGDYCRLNHFNGILQALKDAEFVPPSLCTIQFDGRRGAGSTHFVFPPIAVPSRWRATNAFFSQIFSPPFYFGWPPCGTHEVRIIRVAPDHLPIALTRV